VCLTRAPVVLLSTVAVMGADVVDELRDAGVGRGDLVALVVAPSGAAIATPGLVRTGLDVASAVRSIEATVQPRWVVWSGATAAALIAEGVRVATCWDVAAVHRLLYGGWRADPGRVWARLHDLPSDTLPAVGPPDLFTTVDDRLDPEQPLRDDGHVDAAWTAGAWAETPPRAGHWAALALAAASAQQTRLRSAADGRRFESTARSESTAELLCAELAADGLPVDRAAAEAFIAALVGPRPRDDAEATAIRGRRDREVLRLVPGADDVDLRSVGQVKALLAGVGVDVPDTRAWRLEALCDAHPVVPALLAWRKAERVATTYGYDWLDRHVGADGRLRGDWSASDGAAGRMTASAGLHNLPADMRAAVVAEPGHALVRADLGQIEPRVLAAVAGDRALALACAADDMYAPVAAELGVDRATAKVAVLGAMYGQTTGHGAGALRSLQAAYPVAMAYLEAGDRAGRSGMPLRTYGGRCVRMRPIDPTLPAAQARAVAAAQGRYGRNALVQGAAAELFKIWAVTMRARGRALGARIVLCLHDELLVHVPLDHAAAAAALLDECLQEAARRWAPDTTVRFIADISTLTRWSDAKP
jgi:DNA polymerase-1